MKKLMIVAAAALCAAVGFADGIESSNIVGYADSPKSVEQYNFLAIGFNSVGYNTTDIQQIKISDGGQSSIGWGTETFSIWAGGPDVVEGSDAYIYMDPSLDPLAEATDYFWGDDQGNKAEYSIAPGQGVVIQMAAGDLTIQTSGEVPMTDVTVKSVEQYNFIGNPFPAAIDIQNIKISDGGAQSIGWGTETFSIWAGGPDVVEGSDAFIYMDPSLDPLAEATDYFWGDDQGNRATYPIAAGQGFVIQMAAADLDITITKPYTVSE